METKTRLNVRTRKAIERENKKEKKAMLKRQFLKATKLFIKTLVILIVVYVIFILIEVNRFKNNLGILPGIIKSEEITEDSIIYTGRGYTVTYKYIKAFEEYNDGKQPKDEDIVSGEFKMFNKWLLSAWVK